MGELCSEHTKILPEVLEQIFVTVNHRTLKLCRLICKEWNLECCRVLRKRSILRVSECDNLKLKSLDDLLTQNGSLNLPLPFRFCNVEIDVLENPIVQQIVEDDEFCVTVLGIREPLQLHHKGVLMKLSESSNARQSNLLEQLVLTLSSSKAENFSITNSDSEQETLNFPKLREIVLNGKHLERRLDEGNVISVPPVRLAVDAINSAQKLESFISSLWDDAILLFILQHAKLQNLSRLSLSHTTPNTFHQLLSIDIRNLKILELSVDPDSIDEGFVGSEVAREVVEKYAQSLQELYITWNFNSVNDKFPYCPNLRVLSIKYWSGGLGSFDSLKLPSLKKLQVFDCINELCKERLNPHSGVEAFAFECLNGTGVRFGLYSEEDFTQVLMNVNRQFPNLTCLDLRLALTASALQRVVLHFPNLKKLLLESDNEYKECIFTGVPEQDLDSSQEPYEADPVDSCGTPSFLDLKYLEHLVLARQYEHHFPFDVAVTDKVIQLGLSRMPKLRSIQFDWEEGLSMEVFVKHLSHLTNIVINYAEDMNDVCVLKELERRMPQVSLNLCTPSFIQQVSSRLRRSSTRRPRRIHRQLGVV